MHLTSLFKIMRREIIIKPLLALTFIAILFSCKNESKEGSKEEPQQTKSLKKEEPTLPDSIMQFHQTKYPNGQVKFEGNMQNGFREGKWVSFYEDGMIWSETHFHKGQKDGATTTWYPNGIRRYTGQYKMEQEAGKWIYYDETGKIAEEKVYK